MSQLTVERRPDGVAIVDLDTPGSPVNVLSRELMLEVAARLDELEGDPAIRACVIGSAKPGTFVAGADLDQLLAVATAEEGAAFSREGRAILDRIARSPRPWVAAIHGPALGGGLELALACHYRLAADDPGTVLALPEVQLGLLPGGGGTQRLPRLVGLTRALPLLLTGKRLRAAQALRLGLVDALTSPGGIRETAARAALDLAEGRLAPRRPKPALGERLLGSALGRGIVFRKARADVQRKTRGLYPAPPAILECVETGLARGERAGGEKESELFGRLTATPEAKALIGLFHAMTAVKKKLPGAEPRPVRRLAVLGGGFMGAGIATVSLPHASVVVKDISEEVLARCAKGVWDELEGRVKRRASTRFERDVRFARLHATTDPAAIARADLVIEAVFEDLALKRRVLAETEEVVPASAIFASNTSALPIGEIAAGARHPERILGMHYFSPVPKMPLLELIVTERTADWAVATARAFGIQQGKTVIVVRDGPGFYTSRILSPFVNEAIVLLEEGARVEDVDRAIKDFGYPVGPLALLDEIGLDVAAHVGENFGARFASRGLGPSPALRRLVERGLKGRKGGAGFYRYDAGKGKGAKPVNPAVYEVLGSPARREIASGEIADRLVLLMVNEAAHCLEEGIVASPRDADVGAILGLGFPPFRGGPFRHADAVGARAVERLARYAEHIGPRFAPAKLLRETTGAGRLFYA